MAKGDLKTFLKCYIRYDVIRNCLAQILLCILSFHKHTGLAHNDCYYGNFLYHRIQKGGYIHYKINKKDFYIENLGYLWMINDFDMAEGQEDTYTDYKVAMEAFVNYTRIKKFNILVKEVLSIINSNNDDYKLFDALLEKLYTCDGNDDNVWNVTPYVL